MSRPPREFPEVDEGREVPVDEFQRAHLDEAERVRIARLRAMTPEEKLRIAHDLYWSARRMKAAYLRQRHPDWSDERVAKEVRDAFLFHWDY